VLTDSEVQRLRTETPGCNERIHFSNAGAALLPSPVPAAMTNYLKFEAAAGRCEAAAARQEQIDDFYRTAAELLGCRPQNVAFTSSATDSVARALSSIPFQPGDVILTTRDDYVSSQIAFISLHKRLGIEILHAPNRPEGGVDVVEMPRPMDQAKPRLVAVTQIPTNSGLVQPVAEIGRHCRERELLYLIDACQSIGQYPLDVTDLGCDFLAATCRKFLRGPRGSGLLYVSDRALQAGYEPLFIDMRGADRTSPTAYEPVASAVHFEDWEKSYAAMIGTATAMRYALLIGMDAINAHALDLASELRARLAEIPHLRLLDRGPELCAIVTHTLANLDSDELHGQLSTRGINTSVSHRLVIPTKRLAAQNPASTQRSRMNRRRPRDSRSGLSRRRVEPCHPCHTTNERSAASWPCRGGPTSKIAPCAAVDPRAGAATLCYPDRKHSPHLGRIAGVDRDSASGLIFSPGVGGEAWVEAGDDGVAELAGYVVLALGCALSDRGDGWPLGFGASTP
jgi:selenocysteine lyase/cysteine desulfurase